MRIDRDQAIRAIRTPHGTATMHIQIDGSSQTVRARAWGVGANWALQALPQLVGEDDDDGPFVSMLERCVEPSRQLLRDLRQRLTGLRIPRTGAITEALVPTIIEQRVTSIEAHRAYRQLVAALGEPAPGPPDVVRGLRVPPSPRVLFSTPYWAFHRFGIERRRAEAVRMACSYAARLDALAYLPPGEAQTRLAELPGVGMWSAAEVAYVALGDPDAVSVGDFHLPHQIAWALTGVPRGNDETMLRLLEPYRGQRGRVVRLIVGAGISAPRRGPRAPIESFRNR